MQQLSTILYLVEQGENVTINASLENGAIPQALQVFKNGASLPNLGGNQPRFQFTVDGQVGAVMPIGFLCSFAGLPPTANAMVRTQVQGAPNPGITIDQSLGNTRVDMFFQVVQSVPHAVNEIMETLTAAAPKKKRKPKKTQ